VKTIFIDPGLNGTGYAVYTPKWHLLFSGNINISGQYPWEIRGQRIEKRIIEMVARQEITHAYIEFPSYFGSASGQMVAARGDLVKLTWLVGLLYGVFKSGQAMLLPVREWKGQLPKEVVIKRIKQILPQEVWKKFKTHTWDAVGMALYVKGDL